MNYQEFLQYVKTQVSQVLGKEVCVSIHKVKKNNGICLDTLSALPQNECMAPSIYLNDFYEEYKEGKSLHLIIQDILDNQQAKRFKDKIEVGFFKEFSQVSDKIAYKLINYKKNEALLKEIPHVKLLDLAIVFFCVLKNEIFEFATILIYNSHLKLWKISVEELLVYARNNTPRLLSGTFQSMDNVMQDIASLEVEKLESNKAVLSNQIKQEINLSEHLTPMYVLSNTDKTFGAITILYDGVLALIAELLKADLYILPSSIHECIIVPVSDNYTKSSLMEMVRDINETQVAVEEVLSNCVYTYIKEKDEVSF